MIYGNVMTYKYEDMKLDAAGDFLRDEQGNRVPEEKQITLVFNPVTLIKYKNYTGKDFMSDLFLFGEKSIKAKDAFSKKVRDKIDRGEEPTLADFEESDLSNVSPNMLDGEFILNLIGAMLAAAKPQEQKDFLEIINEVPIALIYDPDFMRELMELISFGLKKNTRTFRQILHRHPN